MRKSIKRILSVALVTVMAVSLTACGNGAGGTDGGATTGTGDATTGTAADKVFKIGGIGPTTGSNAAYGNAVKTGAQVAVDEINENGGINGTKLELIFEDDQSKGDQALQAYNSLMDKGVNAILGTVTSDPCIAISEDTYNDGILMLTPSGSAQECTKYDNAFRICFTDPIQGVTMSNFIKNELKLKKVAVLYDVSSDYGTGIHDAFITEAKNDGLDVVADQSYSANDKDFKTQLTTIKAAAPDVIFVPGYYQEAAYILTQAEQVGITTPFVGSDGWDSILGQFEKGSTQLADGAIFLSPFFADDQTPVVKSFVDKYVAAYNETPSQFAADGYDGIYAIAKAYEKAGSTDNAAIIAAMTEIEVEGTTGTFTFTKEGEPNKAAKMIQIVDGKYTMYENK